MKHIYLALILAAFALASIFFNAMIVINTKGESLDNAVKEYK